MNNRVERVLVVINAAPRRDDALDAGMELASSFRAPLMALFVEDINLVRLSGLPFAKELDRSSGVLRPLDPHSLDRALEAEARKLKTRLRAESKRKRISASMQIVRGHYVRTAMQMARTQDIVLVDDAKQATTTGASSHRWQQPVWVLYDGTQQGRRALALAASLGQSYDVDVVILTAADPGDDDIEEQIGILPSECQSKCRVLQLSDTKSVAAAARNRGCAVLLLPRGSGHAPASGLLDAEVRCPRILV